MPQMVDWVGSHGKKLALLGLHVLFCGPQLCQNALAHDAPDPLVGCRMGIPRLNPTPSMPWFSHLRRSASVAFNVKFWLRPWSKCNNKTQGNAVFPPPIYGSKRSPPQIVIMLGKGARPMTGCLNLNLCNQRGLPITWLLGS